jgi:hypothetical protein
MTRRKNKKKIPADNQVVSREDIPDRFVNLLGNQDLTDWEKVFCRSMGSKYSERGSLTNGQYKTLCEVERNHSPEVVQRHQQWFASWDAEKERIYARMIRYYEMCGASSHLHLQRAKNPKYIPSEKEYKRACENRFALHLMALDKTPPHFQVGELAIMESYEGLRLVTILEHEEMRRPEVGARPTKVFFNHDRAGSVDVMWTEESYLRQPRPELLAQIDTDFSSF